MNKTLPVAALVLLAATAFAVKDKMGSKTHVMAVPGAIEWKEGPKALPPGAQAAVLEGDPSKPGFFALRAKLKDGYTIPPHHHPVQERVTVIQGTFLLGQGEKFDKAKLKEYPAGSYLSMPAGMRHFAMTKGDTVIQLTTEGPWDIIYVDPADDPRKQTSR